MRSRYLFLLVYLLWTCCATTSLAKTKKSCAPKEQCGQQDSTADFLQCVGLPQNDTGRDHLRRLKGMLEATMDVYTFMRSSMSGVPLLTMEGALELNPRADPFQNEDLVHMWLEVKMKPLLKSITAHFLTCLSSENFSCASYQKVVYELSQYYSEMDPVRQKWVYTFFMYPFLAGNRAAGCVNGSESSEEWLLKNFGSFRAMARMADFSQLNMVFSGFEVLHLLSPAQKAELLLQPGVESLDNGTLTLVFHSMLTGDQNPHPTEIPDWGNNSMTPGYSTPYQTEPYNPYKPASPHDQLGGVAKTFMTVFKPFRSLVHNFVSLVHEMDVSEMKSTTLAQLLINWSLGELADMYRPKETPVVPQRPEFDVTNVEDWYSQVVIPLLGRLLPHEAYMEIPSIKMAFHEAFFLDHVTNDNSIDIMDVCSITLDQIPCGLNDAVTNVAHVMHCAARTHFSLNEGTMRTLMMELLGRLNLLLKELSQTDFHDLAKDFKEIFREPESPALTPEHLQDPDFIKLWFQVKLMPLLPDIPIPLLSCLSTKNFSCPVFQTIVAELSEHMSYMCNNPMLRRNIFEFFILPFLLRNNTIDPQCVSSANGSVQYLLQNFGAFSEFASVTDFYQLNSNFNGLEVLPFLTSKQIAELLVVPLPTPPEKPFVVDRVFDFLSESPETFTEVLPFLAEFAEEVNVPCEGYTRIFERLYEAVPSVPPDVEPDVWATINDLIAVAPKECVPANVTCPVIRFNADEICRKVDSYALQHYLKKSVTVNCSFPLETFACTELRNFTAGQLASLLQCDLPGNTSRSRVLWKMLLTRVSDVLDPALDILANQTVVIPSAREILDVLGEIRISLLTDEELMDSRSIRLWFSKRLRAFLPFASRTFLDCIGMRNISCTAYQQILDEFILDFDGLPEGQRRAILREFVLRYLSRSAPGCVAISNSSADFLLNSLGPFSEFLSVQDIIDLNPLFNPLEVLGLLTAEQSAELLSLPLPNVTQVEIVNALFDNLAQNPNDAFMQVLLNRLIVVLGQGNFSCDGYIVLFRRLDIIQASAGSDVAAAITFTRTALSQNIPQDCSLISRQCNFTITNETDICLGVNSTVLDQTIQSGSLSGRVCDFSVEEYACASLTGLRAEDLANLLRCNRPANDSSPRAVWKLLLSKAAPVLDAALDRLRGNELNPRNSEVSVILDALREIRVDSLSQTAINDPATIELWFNQRLAPFLPAVSPEFLSCITTRGLTCNTFQRLVSICNQAFPVMLPTTQMSVYTNFIDDFLSMNNTANPGCRDGINSSDLWIAVNLGSFADFASFEDLMRLDPEFSAMEALPLLSPNQLAQLAASPGQITSAAQVDMLLRFVPDSQLSEFFDAFVANIEGRENEVPFNVRAAYLRIAIVRANLSDPSVSDVVVVEWLEGRLGPLVINISVSQVSFFFSILSGRGCDVQMLGVDTLSARLPTFSDDTVDAVRSQIAQLLREEPALQCYGTNFTVSFVTFLVSTFGGFGLPPVSTVLEIIPPDSRQEVVNSIPPSDLASFLSEPGVLDDETALCTIYELYELAPFFIENEILPEEVQRQTLPCVWPLALSSSDRFAVEAYFRGFVNYTTFLNLNLIGPQTTQNATCAAFQGFIELLSQANFSTSGFQESDVYTSIMRYLTTVQSSPKCYDPNDPELNSTAWIHLYIGRFISFLTLDDLQAFVPEQVLRVFTVDPLNIALLNTPNLPVNLTAFYIRLLYTQDSNFNPLGLPASLWCDVPGPAFIQLNREESMMVLGNVTQICTDLDPQISAALAGNLGDSLDATDIAFLGNQTTSLTTAQILTISPQEIQNAIQVLNKVTGFNRGQLQAIFSLLQSSGMQINSAAALIMLGTLSTGVPSSVIRNIDGAELITAGQSASFLSSFLSAPDSVRQTFVSRIINVNARTISIIQNVPDAVATEIPRSLLIDFTEIVSVLETLNRKTWTRDQSQLFFGIIASESATALLGGVDRLSSSVLQGFSCPMVGGFPLTQIKKLIRASRRTGTDRVNLDESQLTCMYNLLREEPDVTDFRSFPPDILLYYNYSLVSVNICRSYFEELSNADFFVLSEDIRFKWDELFSNARNCLGITNTDLTSDNIEVLGNMLCTVDGSFYENSDPSILEVLKDCSDLTASQAASVETLLRSGRTRFGPPSGWNEDTLVELGNLTLYFSSDFYANFSITTKREFLRVFLAANRGTVDRQKIRALKTEIRRSLPLQPKTTGGNITHVTIRDEAFPFGYDVTEFNCCLSVVVVRDNLAELAERVDELDFQRIVLKKVMEAYPGSSGIPESQVVLLAQISRTATLQDIALWNITDIDTLSALMNPVHGEWNPSLARAIIIKYLTVGGNTLGTLELNAIGVNLCSLDIAMLRNISSESLRNAKPLGLSNCSFEASTVLFNISEIAFASANRATAIPADTYHLLEPYLSGADIEFARSLAVSNLNLDMRTVLTMDRSIILGLTVDQMQGILGVNVIDLKTYENVTVLQTWITSQLQVDLDKLNIGLQGGMVVETNTTTSSPATTGTGATTPTGATNQTEATTQTGATNQTGATTQTGATNQTVATTPAGATNQTAATTQTGATNQTGATTQTGATNQTGATTQIGATNQTAAPTPAGATNQTGVTTQTGATNQTGATTQTGVTNQTEATTQAGSTTQAGVTTQARTTATPTPASGTTNTTGSGVRLRPDAGISFFVLLVLLFTSQHIFV